LPQKIVYFSQKLIKVKNLKTYIDKLHIEMLSNELAKHLDRKFDYSLEFARIRLFIMPVCEKSRFNFHFLPKNFRLNTEIAVAYLTVIVRRLFVALPFAPGLRISQKNTHLKCQRKLVHKLLI
jgi:hypothetical protein